MNPRKTTDFIIIHCTATRPSQDIGVNDIRHMHMTRGFSDIGYHFVIRRSGEICAGRDRDLIGAHAKGYNARSIGVALVGGVHETKMQGRWPAPESNFTEAQWEALDETVDALLEAFPGASVIGHNEVAAKACPSFDVQEWLINRHQYELDRDGVMPLLRLDIPPLVRVDGSAGLPGNVCPRCGRPT